MPRCRVVVPESDRLPLSDGDWIDVKRELNAGEADQFLRDLQERKPFAKILTYVLAWSMINRDGTAIPWDLDAPEDVRRSAVAALDTGTIPEMSAAINRHVVKQDAVYAAKKKTPPDAPRSSLISTSPDAATGPSTTSALSVERTTT